MIGRRKVLNWKLKILNELFIFVAEAFLFHLTEVVLTTTVTLSGDGEAKRNRRSRMGITLVGSNIGDFICQE